MFERQGVETTEQTARTAPLTPLDLREILEDESTALRALGELLGTARLSEFDHQRFTTNSACDSKAKELQHGLSKLIDLCLDNQKRIMARYAEQYLDSDACLLNQAEGIVAMAEQGAFSYDHAAEKMSEALRHAEIVACRRGPLADRAKALETSILNHDLFLQLRPAKGNPRKLHPIQAHKAGEGEA